MICKRQNVIAKHFAIDYEDKFSINKVENYLLNHLYDKFPEIDVLAKKSKFLKAN